MQTTMPELLSLFGSKTKAIKLKSVKELERVKAIASRKINILFQKEAESVDERSTLEKFVQLKYILD